MVDLGDAILDIVLSLQKIRPMALLDISDSVEAFADEDIWFKGSGIVLLVGTSWVGPWAAYSASCTSASMRKNAKCPFLFSGDVGHAGSLDPSHLREEKKWETQAAPAPGGYRERSPSFA